MVSTDLQTHMVSLSEMQNNSLKTEPIREDTSGMSHKLKVQYWPIDEVHPYPNNPRNNDDAVEYVANSIREFGWQQPIVVDTDGTIIAGHTRHKAAKLLGMDTVPVVVAENLTPAQVNAYRLADNKVAEAATWDFDRLDVELDGLQVDFDMMDFGFDTLGIDFEEFDGIGDGGGSRMGSGSGCRVCIGPHIADIKEDGDECFQRAKALSPDRIVEFVHDALMNGDLS